MYDPNDPHTSWHWQQPWPPAGGASRPWRPRPDGSALRTSDAERAAVTEQLCRHYADGRLDEAEFNDRASRAAAAKTRGELGPLLADLPPLDQPGVPAPAGRHHGWLWVLAVFAVLWVAAGWAFALLHLAVHAFFPWPLILIAVILVARRRHHHRRLGAGDWS